MSSEIIQALFNVLTLVLIIWTTLTSILILKQKQFFTQFTSGLAKKDLKSLLVDISNQLKLINNRLSNQQKQIDTIVDLANSHFQKSGFVRFNPYSDTGGDQSFCLCLLDNNNNGIVITSLHSREQTRIYAKSIEKGKVEGSKPSKEEKEALKKAMGK